MLMQSQQSALLVVDVQQKLTPHVFEQQQLVDNCSWLMQVAREISVPILVSEQYPKGLGRTVDALQVHANEGEYLSKIHFSCAADEHCCKAIDALGKQQIIIVGIEAHVCVLQTALDLHQKHYHVYVVADAISSRSASDKHAAISRMTHAGVNIVTKEMVFFEWCHQAGTQQFKQLSQRFMK